jgi:hypothetical protein
MCLVLMTLINWLLKLKMHVNTYVFFLIFLYENTIWIFYIFKRLSWMHENKTFFLLFFYIIFFATFQRKSTTLISYLYLYSVKYKPILSKFDIKIREKNHNFFQGFFGIFLFFYLIYNIILYIIIII